ncbi:MAG: hypothetical protein IT180_04595 [Acidobacteria bacterium]|nr:hypothetical protein [Acidobacteriota bacterium]
MMVLASRLALFAIFQVLIAGALAVAGVPAPWHSSAGWWPIAATLTNVVSLAILWSSTRTAGAPLRAVFGWSGGVAQDDLPLLAGILLLTGPVALIPNLVLANVLFGHSDAALAMLVQPIPTWAAMIGLIAFPVTVALAELPACYGFVLPRLQEAWSDRWTALYVVVAGHAAQHVTLPLIFDVPFIAWRLLMFLPLAFLLGVAIQRRRPVLPYLMVAHGLLDAGAAYLVLEASRGVARGSSVRTPRSTASHQAGGSLQRRGLESGAAPRDNGSSRNLLDLQLAVGWCLWMRLSRSRSRCRQISSRVRTCRSWA